MRKKDIFITDNDYTTIAQIQEYFNDSNFNVSGYAYSGTETLEKFKKNIPDILLLNIKLDERINGSNTSNFIIKEFNIPIIFLTSDKNINSYNSLVNGLIKKPIIKEELFKSIELIHNNQMGENSKLTYPLFNTQFEEIINNYGYPVLNFIKKYSSLLDNSTIILSTNSRFNIKIFPLNIYKSIVNLERVNGIKHLNKFFETINETLPFNGTFIGCGETKGFRKKRILKKYPFMLNYIYYFLDFIIKRVFPKLSLTKKIYFFITGGRNRVLSRPEILGRLYSCGFEIIDEQFINNVYFFSVKKIKIPCYDFHPTYGLIVRMQRLGKNGKLINILKVRTMHPYSEYLQDYIYKKNNLSEGGKFKNDFRITTIGKIMRKFWIDELPMIYNLIKGDIKFFGVRPLSEHYFSLYPDEYKKIRLKFKPGLIPPFYVDLPKSFDEIISSERKYLEKYSKHPFITDFKYFFKALINILFRKARSS